MKGSHTQQLKQRLWRTAAYCLADLRLPRVSTTHSALGPPTQSNINQEKASIHLPISQSDEVCSQSRFPLPR